jgi:hypothetical protein
MSDEFYFHKDASYIFNNWDYDVVASLSLRALQGRADGWCDPRLVSQTPLIYELYSDSYKSISGTRINGQKIGTFELRRHPQGGCEISFWSLRLLERKSLELDLGEEKAKEKIKSLNERLEMAVNGYYGFLAMEGIVPGKPVQLAPAEQENSFIDDLWISEKEAPSWITTKTLQRYIKKKRT